MRRSVVQSGCIAAAFAWQEYRGARTRCTSRDAQSIIYIIHRKEPEHKFEEECNASCRVADADLKEV